MNELKRIIVLIGLICMSCAPHKSTSDVSTPSLLNQTLTITKAWVSLDHQTALDLTKAHLGQMNDVEAVFNGGTRCTVRVMLTGSLSSGDYEIFPNPACFPNDEQGTYALDTAKSQLVLCRKPSNQCTGFY